MQVSSFIAMQLSLLVGLLLATESSAAKSGHQVEPEASIALSQAASQVENHAALRKRRLGDEMMDMKRLNALSGVILQQNDQQQQQQQQLLPLATSDHETRVSYLNVPLNMDDLLIASHSMPAGRRRLDLDSDVRFVSGRQALLDANEVDPVAVARETLITAAALNRQANRPRPNMNQYGKIVDNGAGSLYDDRYPSAQLMAKLASVDHRRLANLNSQQRQQALVNKMARRQLDVGGRRPAGSQMARQESQPRRAKSAGRTREGAKESEEEDEYDELEGRAESSNRERDGASGDPEEGAEGDDEGADEPGATSSRRSSDPFFDETDAEEGRDSAKQDDLGDSNDEHARQHGVVRPQRQMLRRQGGQQARSRPRQAASHLQASRQIDRHGRDGHKESWRPKRQGAIAKRSEHIDSTNSRQQFVQANLRPGASVGRLGADLRQPLAFNDVNSINGRASGLARRRPRPAKTASQFNEAGANSLQDVDDSDLSASHIRNSATDLQVAAGHHHGHGHYYQHVEVPKKKAWKFGFKRGNHKHTIEKHEKGYKHKFHTKFMWHAKEKCKKKSKCESVGKMSWDYKHHKKHHH